MNPSDIRPGRPYRPARIGLCRWIGSILHRIARCPRKPRPGEKTVRAEIMRQRRDERTNARRKAIQRRINRAKAHAKERTNQCQQR